MNARQLYLGWVRTAHPALYGRALVSVFGKGGGLSGLGDDLTSSISAPDLVSSDDIISGVSDIGVTSDVSDAINTAYNSTVASPSTSSGDFFSSLANAISSIAPTVVQTQAAENLLQINTQRAAQGLAPLTANGIPVTSSMLSPTSATLAQMEAALSGSSGFILPLLLVGGVVVLAMAMKK